MTVHYADPTVTVHAGDCLDVLRELPDASVDAVVTDPPYGLEFMGKDWDSFKNANDWGRLGDTQPWEVRPKGGTDPFQGDRPRFHAGAPFQTWCQLWAAECLRVLRPGGHLLAFGGTRTSHRLTCAIEDAGFEIRDSIAWLYGSGFPKSLDVSRAIDKAAGAAREVVGSKITGNAKQRTSRTGEFADGLHGGQQLVDVTAPATDDARTWQGFGTSLKPAHEPITVARKPLSGTVAATVLAHGTGALNIDGCRVGAGESVPGGGGFRGGATSRHEGWTRPSHADGYATEAHTAGRWPANVVLDEDQAAALDAMSGETGAHGVGRGESNSLGVLGWTSKGGVTDDPDTGGASRFFFVASDDDVTTSQGGMIDPCGSANTAAQSSSQQSEPDASAPSDAATLGSPEENSKPQRRAPSTSATARGSRLNESSDTPPTPSTDAKSSPASRQPKPSPTSSRANTAEQSEPTDTTTTTASPSKSDGSADPATSPITSSSREPGAAALPIDTLGSRFTYTAKASSAERIRLDGAAHPTVKPLALMRWLVRLVTPPMTPDGQPGLVLDCFAGSGTTVEAAILEGFRCIAIEREADYLPLITQRIHRRRDPVAYIVGSGEDGGLFDLDGGAA